jgi:hypothetical protein
VPPSRKINAALAAGGMFLNSEIWKGNLPKALILKNRQIKKFQRTITQ